jgi:hypothetical protein
MSCEVLLKPRRKNEQAELLIRGNGICVYLPFYTPTITVYKLTKVIKNGDTEKMMVNVDVRPWSMIITNGDIEIQLWRYQNKNLLTVVGAHETTLVDIEISDPQSFCEKIFSIIKKRCFESRHANVTVRPRGCSYTRFEAEKYEYDQYVYDSD